MPDDTSNSYASISLGASQRRQPCATCPKRQSGLCAVLIAEGLDGQVRPRTYQRRTTLRNEGEPLRHAFILRSGVVSLSRELSGGRRQVIDFLMSGDVLGVANEASMNMTASVLEEAEVCQIPIEVLTQPARSAVFFRGLLGLVEMATRRVHDHIVVLGKLKAEERMIAFLLRYRASRQRIQAMQSRLDLPMTRRDIADHLGMAPETVSRVLSWLQEKQLVVTIPDGVRVLDIAALQSLVTPQERPVATNRGHVARYDAGTDVLSSLVPA